MSDSPQYEAFREFARATIALEVLRAAQPLHEEIRSLRSQLETRSSVQPIVGPQGERGERGERGDVGPAGPRGEPGERGAAGPAGERGERGDAGSVGPKGEQGERGAPGPMGERGADGVAGRDGAPSTVPGPRGEKGERGERGADGIATVAELDARIEARFAELQVRTFADVYQGIYESDKLYARGLLATWGGSLWLTLNETRSKPGETEDWRLVVKRGADGRK